MWPSDFIDALENFKRITGGQVLIDSVTSNAFGDRFIFKTTDLPDNAYYVYFPYTKTLVQQWPDTWRNPDHAPVVVIPKET